MRADSKMVTFRGGVEVQKAYQTPKVSVKRFDDRQDIITSSGDVRDFNAKWLEGFEG